MKLSISIIFCVIQLISLTNSKLGEKRKCGIHKKNNKTRNNVDTFGEHKRLLTGSTWQPIRIYIDYTMLDSQKLDASFSLNLKTALGQTITMFQNLINVKRSPYNLIIPSCDDSLIVGTAVTKTGVAADLVIVPFMDYSAADGIEAQAGPCAYENSTNRPIMGSIGYSNLTDFSPTNSLEYYTLLSLHELTHVLVFNSDNFDTFIDSNGVLLGINNIIVNTTINGSPRTLIKTPKVIVAAKKHYGCNNVIGVETENQGGEGTVGSHWESRIMLGDYMIGQSYEENIISDISLALFEDSGWYTANYYNAGLFRFGKDEGCGFLNTRCIVNNATSFPNEFCTIPAASRCTAGRLAKGYCSETTIQNLPSQYQFFSNRNIGGYEMADFCTTANSDDASDSYFTNLCTIGISYYPTSLGETIGPTSSCYESSLTPSADNSISSYKGQNFAICYASTCNDDNTISVTISGKIVKCPTSGGQVQVDGFDGFLICPDYNLICTGAIGNCGTAVDCALKKISSLSSSYVYSYTPNNTLDFTNSLIISNPYVYPINSSSLSTTTNSNFLSSSLILFFIVLLLL